MIKVIYGQQNFWQKSTGRVNKAYAEAVTTNGEYVIVVWDMGCARSIRDEFLHYCYRQFCDMYGLNSAYAIPAKDAKNAIKRGVRVIVVNN